MFYESNEKIIIKDGAGNSVKMTLLEFLELEPTYPPVGAGNTRYWTEDLAYISLQGRQQGDLYYSGSQKNYYESKVDDYIADLTILRQADNEDFPEIYATINLSGGDGKDPIGLKLGDPVTGIMNIFGDLRADPDVAGSLPVNITFTWRITLRKVISENNQSPIDSFPLDGVQVTDNIISWTDFDAEPIGLSPGIYLISDEDFATISGADFGLLEDYRVKLVGGPKLFKVLA